MILFAHVAAGALAVLAGVAALAARKGGGAHRLAGRVFLCAMLVTGLGGAIHALSIPQSITAIAGVFVVYLVATGYATVRPLGRHATPVVAVACLVSIGLAALAAVFGQQALASASGLKDGFGPEPYFFFAGLSALCALLDVSVMARGGVAGAQRIARHLWRMGFALHIAVGSLFTGPGSGAFPEPLRGSPLLAAPELLVLIAMVGWMAFVLVSKQFRAA